MVPDFRQPADDAFHRVVRVLPLAGRSRAVDGLGDETAAQLAGEQTAHWLGVDAVQHPAEVVMGQLEVR